MGLNLKISLQYFEVSEKMNKTEKKKINCYFHDISNIRLIVSIKQSIVNEIGDC